jgi:hypothetical protein
VTEGPDQSNWWPADLGIPSSLGAQNEVRYAYFPVTRRLAIDINGIVPSNVFTAHYLPHR